MGHVIFGMNTSVDGYVAGPSGSAEDMPAPSDELHQYFNDLQRSAALSLYGRELYTDMQYWDTDDPDWPAVQKEFADLLARHPEGGGVDDAHRGRPERHPGLGGRGCGAAAHRRRDRRRDRRRRSRRSPRRSPGLGLIDEYRIYQRPVVLGGGKPFFAAETPALSLLDVEMLPEDTVLLRYQPVR